jgi:hypothetical protein
MKEKTMISLYLLATRIMVWMSQRLTLCILALLVATGVYLSYLKLTTTTTQVASIAVVNPVVSTETKVVAPIKTIKVYKASTKKKLGLPQIVVSAPTVQVTDSSLVKSQENPQVVTQVVDTETGETQVYVSNAPLPWFATEERGSISLAYGIKLPTAQLVGRLTVREDLLQIKGIHLGVTATADTDGQAFAGGSASYRW